VLPSLLLVLVGLAGDTTPLFTEAHFSSSSLHELAILLIPMSSRMFKPKQVRACIVYLCVCVERMILILLSECMCGSLVCFAYVLLEYLYVSALWCVFYPLDVLSRLLACLVTWFWCTLVLIVVISPVTKILVGRNQIPTMLVFLCVVCLHVGLSVCLCVPVCLVCIMGANVCLCVYCLATWSAVVRTRGSSTVSHRPSGFV
jgi:hypothetical protein